jgi:UrcA family protein
MFAKTIATIAALAALGFATSGHAASPAVSDPDTVTVKVNIADLNLSSQAGASTVLRRIHEAADQICGGAPSIKDLVAFSAYKSCVTSVTDRTVASLDNPYVTAMNGGARKSSTVLASNPR